MVNCFFLSLVCGDWNHAIFIDFPFSWEFHHPNWRSPSFFRGVETTNQWSWWFKYGTIKMLNRDFVRLSFKGTTKKARKYWCHRTIQNNHVNTYTFNNSNQKFIGLAFLGKSKRKPLCFTTNSLVFYRVFLTFCSLQPIEGNPMIYGWHHQKLGTLRRNMKQYLVGGLEHVFS